MIDDTQNFSVTFLKERAKELECLYLVDDALTNSSLSDILMEVSKVLPSGFCNVNDCIVTIFFDDEIYSAKPVISNGNEIQSAIVVNQKVRGYIKAAYEKNEEETAFLVQEEKLLKAVANKIAQFVHQQEIQSQSATRSNWKAIINLLQRTDHTMLLHVCEKMLALLAKDHPNVVQDILNEMDWVKQDYLGEINFPHGSLPAVDVIRLSKGIFRAAKSCLDDTQIFDEISLWIYQGKTYELIKLVGKKDSDVKDISHALLQYGKAMSTSENSSRTTKRWLIVELMRRFLTDEPRLMENARRYLSTEDFSQLLSTLICSPKSSGRVGGKAAGFFLANKIVQACLGQDPDFKNIKMLKTWFISADELENLLHDNHLDELNEHKYRDIFEVRISYPKIVQSIKNSRLSPYVMTELSQILDQCTDKPLIIRSSSLLEDQKNSSFSGKYKSLFLTNTGTKEERLQSLVDGILEIYASMFSPDSIQYRRERNLLDCAEQMGIMIQEVVGRRIGPYYFPLYAGVAFSNNEFRWSPRINREDGLLRMVMGLGTRAVDRVGDDFPVLISPGQPKLRVNQVPQEIRRYSPQMMDVIDVETNRFVSVPISEMIREYGREIPFLNHAASILKEDFVSELNTFDVDYKNDQFIVTFDGLISRTGMISQMQTILSLLKEKLGYPVDIEFASDGETFYLLQCRPQSKSRGSFPVPIPTNISPQSTIFTADKYISNGKVTGIKTVVYVDPEAYGNLERHEDLVRVGNAIGELNRILYRRSFILMGPGRWGSRGDIKLGVKVTYSDISNAAMLIEISQKKSKHQPELSFGTHFFQDLVEADIKYLPLYPENSGIQFQKSFFTQNTNALEKILPAYADLDDVIKVINIGENYYRKELNILMNADLERAVAYLDHSPKPGQRPSSFIEEPEDKTEQDEGQGWKWRHYMAEKIAAKMDCKSFGVKGIYLFGSTCNCTARLNSDIDLLIHFNGTQKQKEELDTWLSGWSMALSEINFLKTGYQSDGLLDVHYVTDRDIEEKDSYASKINSVYDPATPLRIVED